MGLLPQNMFLSARVALLGTNLISVGAHGVLCQVAGGTPQNQSTVFWPTGPISESERLTYL